MANFAPYMSKVLRKIITKFKNPNVAVNYAKGNEKYLS